MSGPMPLGYATPAPPKPSSRFGRGLLGWLIFVGVAALLFALLRQSDSQYTSLALSDFYSQVKAGNVARVSIDADSVEGQLRSRTMLGGLSVLDFRTSLPAGTGSSWGFTQWLLDASPPTTVVQAEPTNGILSNIILPLIPWILILGFLWFFVFRQLRKNGAQRQPMPLVTVNSEGR